MGFFVSGGNGRMTRGTRPWFSLLVGEVSGTAYRKR